MRFPGAPATLVLTDSSDPSRKMMRQIAGSFAEYEKARLVAKLKRELPRPSLRDISAELFARGHATPAGKAYSASAVQSMLG
jgi:hypothetical protein